MTGSDTTTPSKTPRKLFVLWLNLAVFAVAMLAMAWNCGWLLTTKNPYPHSAMASAYFVFLITGIHFVIASFMLIALVVIRAWKYAVISAGFLAISMTPATLLLIFN